MELASDQSQKEDLSISPAVFIGVALLFVSGVLMVETCRQLYIPLPSGITDRSKLQIFEFILRLTYYYPARHLALLNRRLQLQWVRNSISFYIRLLNYISPSYWLPRDIETQDIMLDGVPARLFRPHHFKHQSKGAIVYLHGGGFVLGGIEDYHGLTREMARKSGLVTVSIEYRLAPEHLFPAGLNDCEQALRRFLIDAQEYNVDPRRVVLMGDSAGGNLASVLARKIRDYPRGLPSLKLQILIYPVLQYIDFHTPSYLKYYREYQGTALLDPVSIARWLMLYIGIDLSEHHIDYILSNNHSAPLFTKSNSRYNRISNHLSHHRLPEKFRTEAEYPVQVPSFSPIEVNPEDHESHFFPGQNVSSIIEKEQFFSHLETFILDPDFSPLLHDDLSRLPKSLVLTCEYDILRDEGALYAERMREAGTTVDWVHYEEGFHAILNFYTEMELARRIIDDITRFIREHV